MQVGYSYWGFLADVKVNDKGEKISTPDGNAFYSWAIIKGLQDRGAEVWQLMPDRDRHAKQFFGLDGMFKMFCTVDRKSAYVDMKKHLYSDVDWTKITKQELKQIWDSIDLDKFDCILHEWRMEIPGRNSLDIVRGEKWQPDYAIQGALIEYCIEKKINLIIFDLDYKITKEQYINLYNKSPLIHLFELGYKWKGVPNTHHVEIPFKYTELLKGCNEINTNLCKFQTDLIYIGNRYERDEYIDKYIPDGLTVTMYGNWLESCRDSQDRWPYIRFGHRAQASEFPQLYNTGLATILFAKPEYYANGFMTARILETVYYGCIPLFPIEYGIDIIKRYAGDYAEYLTVSSANDVENFVKYYLMEHLNERKEIIEGIRKHLNFMDAQYIADDIVCIGRGGLHEV